MTGAPAGASTASMRVRPSRPLSSLLESRMISKPLHALLLAAVVAVAAVAAIAVPAQSQSSRTYNQTDAVFAAMMLPHHEGGVELGEMAADKGENAEVRTLGRQIVTAQTREARTLRSMVRRFRTRKASMPPEVMRREQIDMRRLEQASGTEFDRRWLDVISAHHMGAIQMAQMEVRGGRNAAARRLARQIVAEQRRELGRFNALTAQLGG